MILRHPRLTAHIGEQVAALNVVTPHRRLVLPCPIRESRSSADLVLKLSGVAACPAEPPESTRDAVLLHHLPDTISAN